MLSTCTKTSRAETLLTSQNSQRRTVTGSRHKRSVVQEANADQQDGHMARKDVGTSKNTCLLMELSKPPIIRYSLDNVWVLWFHGDNWPAWWCTNRIAASLSIKRVSNSKCSSSCCVMHLVLDLEESSVWIKSCSHHILSFPYLHYPLTWELLRGVRVDSMLLVTVGNLLPSLTTQNTKLRPRYF